MAMLNLEESKQSILLVVIERDNLDRMKKADPITLESVNVGGLLEPPKYPEKFSMLLAYEDDDDEVYKRVRGDRMEFLRWLERGRKFIKGVDGIEHTFTLPPQKT
jgi:hypothetical protein